MYNPPPHATNSQASMSSIEDGQVWRDTSAEHTYGSYLDSHESYHVRPTQVGGTRSSVVEANGTHHPDITVGLLDDDVKGKKKSFKGRKTVWPGVFFLFLLTVSALGAITYFGIESFKATQKAKEILEEQGIGPNGLPKPPKKLTPPKVCQLPNYVTSEGKIYAKANGKSHQIIFTGINWSGMENGEGIPHGLAFRQSNMEEIAKQMNEQGFNAVRLPLNAKMILDDESPPDLNNFVNLQESPELNVGTYMDMIKQIVQGLAREQIVVLLDIHKIDPAYDKGTSEPLWYTEEIPLNKMLQMYQKLASSLCNNLHYNIIGLDLKNEPIGGCWPENDSDSYCPSNRNWPRAVEKIGSVILEACPNWLIVVEGLHARGEKIQINGGQNLTYDDWFGASFQNASLNPIQLPSNENKMVFAPHFYSPSVYPADYFFQSKPNVVEQIYPEYSNDVQGNKQLQQMMTIVLENAFGKIIEKTGVPVFYGEFGGIYGKEEELKEKTSTRAIDFMIQYAQKKGMSGGFTWSLNPDGVYNFNDKYIDPQTKEKPWNFGLYEDKTYKKYRTDYATGLRQLKGNGIIPCFKVVSDTATDSDLTTEKNTTGTTTTEPAKP